MHFDRIGFDVKNFFNDARNKVGNLASSTYVKVSDATKDMRPEASDVKRAANFLVNAASKTATEVGRLGKDALKTDIAKDAAAGAAVGAIVAVPVPLIGPIGGAVVGASLGVYRNITRGPAPPQVGTQVQQVSPVVIDAVSVPVPTYDKFEELNKLHELMTKGILTEEEFKAEKKKVLDR